MKLLLFLGMMVCCGGQTIFTATASQGDQSICTGVKNANNAVNFNVTCKNPIKGQPSQNFKIYNGSGTQPKVAIPQTLVFGDITCVFGVNQTAYPISWGSLGTVPPNSLVYSCSLNVRTNGVFTGNVPGPFGLVSWP